MLRAVRSRRRFLDLLAYQMHLAERRRYRGTRAVLQKWLNPLEDMPEQDFVKNFRLTKENFTILVHLISPLLPSEQRGIARTMKILIALSFFATGSYQTLVGQSAFHNATQPSVSSIIKYLINTPKRGLRTSYYRHDKYGGAMAIDQVSEALNHPSVFKKIVKWPLERTERNQIKSRKFNILGIVGCIDGTNVAIIRPIDHEERFFNRKGYHSLNVMIICDSDLNILCVDPNSPGSAHDASVWQSHPLSSYLAQLNNQGEEAFLLVEDTPEHTFYMAHVKARNTVERCIGVLKARFRCLLSARALHYTPIKAAKIVNACVVLHNLSNRKPSPIPFLTSEEVEIEYQRQIQDLRAQADEVVQNADRNHRVNVDLLEGCALQHAIMQRLWRERNENRSPPPPPAAP